ARARSHPRTLATAALSPPDRPRRRSASPRRWPRPRRSAWRRARRSGPSPGARSSSACVPARAPRACPDAAKSRSPPAGFTNGMLDWRIATGESGSDASLEMLAECGVQLAELLDRGTNAPGDSDPHALDVRRRAPRPTPEAGGGAQLLGELIDLDPRRA